MSLLTFNEKKNATNLISNLISIESTFVAVSLFL